MAVVWFLTGFWHGSAWNFILWGVFYFIILTLEKAVLLEWFSRSRLTRALGHIWALILVGIGWMIFDHGNLTEAFAIIGGMFGIGTTGLASPAVTYELTHALPLLIVAVIAATPYPARLFVKLRDKHPALALCEPVLLGLALVLGVAYMVSGTFSPFLYYIF
jgi:alginate O-acetyltransferase complex protein AlgI